MFLPRHATVLEDCAPNSACLPVKALAGQDPTEQESGPSMNPPTDWSGPGPHRYIGIGIVAGLIFVVLVLYLTCARRPRRFFDRHFRRTSQPVDEQIQQGKGPSDAFVAPNPLITCPEKARPKSGRSGQSVGFVGNRMLAEHTTDNYVVQHQWDVQQPHIQANHSSDDHSQTPIYPLRRPRT